MRAWARKTFGEEAGDEMADLLSGTGEVIAEALSVDHFPLGDPRGRARVARLCELAKAGRKYDVKWAAGVGAAPPSSSTWRSGRGDSEPGRLPETPVRAANYRSPIPSYCAASFTKVCQVGKRFAFDPVRWSTTRVSSGSK